MASMPELSSLPPIHGLKKRREGAALLELAIEPGVTHEDFMQLLAWLPTVR